MAGLLPSLTPFTTAILSVLCKRAITQHWEGWGTKRPGDEPYREPIKGNGREMSAVVGGSELLGKGCYSNGVGGWGGEGGSHSVRKNSTKMIENAFVLFSHKPHIAMFFFMLVSIADFFCPKLKSYWWLDLCLRRTCSSSLLELSSYTFRTFDSPQARSFMFTKFLGFANIELVLLMDLVMNQ